METKLILWIAYATGVYAFVAGILLNIGTWKANLLFAVALLAGCFRLYFYVIRERQRARIREIEIRERLKLLEDQDFFRNQF